MAVDVMDISDLGEEWYILYFCIMMVQIVKRGRIIANNKKN